MKILNLTPSACFPTPISLSLSRPQRPRILLGANWTIFVRLCALIRNNRGLHITPWQFIIRIDNFPNFFDYTPNLKIYSKENDIDNDSVVVQTLETLVLFTLISCKFRTADLIQMFSKIAVLTATTVCVKGCYLRSYFHHGKVRRKCKKKRK